MFSKEDLFRAPNALAPFYSRFRVADRLLLTGHSHQAWPDCGFDGQKAAWETAAELVDEKWERAFDMADRVKRGYAGLLHDADGDYALASSTHELVIRFLSALPLRKRPRLVTTDGEYHSIRRQLDRLAEEGIDVVKVPADPSAGIAHRLVDAVDDRTAAVLVSSVLYKNAHIVGDLGAVMSACRKRGAELLVDAYHALNAIPYSIEGIEDAFVVGGGYKYCQLGEGNCFLRIPRGCDLRPVITGWFSEFSTLTGVQGAVPVVYGERGDRFAGSTYDPTSHYRAASVLDFFETHALTPEFLRDVSRHQIGRLAGSFDALDLDPKVIARDRETPPERVAGFLALVSPRAGELREGLHERGVLADHRGNVLRLGPAPYHSDSQLDEAVALLGDAVRAIP